MNKKYRFNIHAYAPELNKFEVMTKSEYGYLEYYQEIKLPSSVTKQFTNDYKNNIQIVRNYYKTLHDGKQSLKKHCIINFNHSFERFNEVTFPKSGLYKNQSDVLKVINDFKTKNQGYKQVFIGLDSDKNSIYETVYNKVSYEIKVKVK